MDQVKRIHLPLCGCPTTLKSDINSGHGSSLSHLSRADACSVRKYLSTSHARRSRNKSLVSFAHLLTLQELWCMTLQQ
jgi:hypothetical protein